MSAPVREGDVLAGKYRIDKILGVGGMGVVVAGHHIDLDEKVAIKFLLAETLSNAEAVARFAREARAAVKIKSEHVARVSDVGKLENGSPYMVMEFLDGSDLSSWLAQRGALPIEQAVEFILQACEAIAEAHALGIVHRDLKPANLFVIRRADGLLSVKVLDFGISKMTGLGGSDGAGSLTKTSALMGSPLYMSPEQMQSSKDVDARGDIWALGVILYELLTGAPPFAADTMPELVLRIVTGAPASLRDLRPDAPPGLGEAIAKCLEKDRGKRFQTIGELAQALLPFAPKRSKASVERISGVMMAAGFSASALALPPSSDQRAVTPNAAGTTDGSWGRTTGAKSRRSFIAAGGAVAALVLGIVIVTRRPARALDAPKANPSATGALALATAQLTAPAATAASATDTTGSVQPDTTTNTPPGVPTGSPMTRDSAEAAVSAGKREHAGHKPLEPIAWPAITGMPPTTPAVTPRPIVEPATTPVPAPATAPEHPPMQPAKPIPAKPPVAVLAPVTPKASCNPSFYFDSQGNKHFKPECFK